MRGRDDEGEMSSPGARGKYRFRGAESGYDSYDAGSGRDLGSEDEREEERRRERRERRERRRLREEERAYNEAVEGQRRNRSKAKGSPATSPVKRRDRERDRRGYRRGQDEGDEGSPSRGVRERGYRSRADDLDGERDADAEARRQRRRERHRQRERERERERERSMEAEAISAVPRSKHQSTESTSSASHLLSADALARLASEHQSEERASRTREDDEARRERRRQQKKAAAVGAGAGTLGHDIVEGRSRHKSGARIVSGSYLEEGRSPEMKMRRRGGGGAAMEDQWKDEASWDDSFGDGSRQPRWKFWANWSKRKRIVIGVLMLIILLLAIIIPVAVTVSKNKSDDSGSSSGSSGSSGPSNSNLDSISKDSIPVSTPRYFFKFVNQQELIVVSLSPMQRALSLTLSPGTTPRAST